MNRNAERDVFIEFSYDYGMPVGREFFAKKLHFEPKFTLSGYNVTRKTVADLYAGIDTIPR
ncbi:MAG: hypothetical protein AB2L26_02970 [Ignavibacteria bacterium]